MKFKLKSRPVAVAALALISALGLTGYAVNSSNAIVWTYLGQSSTVASPYTATGIANHAGYTAKYPVSLPVPSMPSNLNARISLMLPEKVDIRNNKQIALSSDDQTNIKLTAPADVWVTFLNEGAGFLNSIGFFTYDPANPPLKPADVKDEQIILPNASIPPLSAATAQGATVHLGNIPAGRAVGFFVVANGWSATGRKLAGKSVPGVNEKIDRNWIYYSIKGLNPEPANSRNLNQHAVLLTDEALTGTDGKTYQRLVLGFEDYLRTSSSDHDFNDVILAVHVSPSSAIGNLAGLSQLVSSTTDGDTDGDGVKDSVDEFPDDPTKAFSRWYPGSSSWGTLAYEDSWPDKGDYDFNDLIVRYRSREVLNASRLVSGLEMDLRLDARGGVFRSGFALSLPGIPPDQIKSASLVGPDGVSVPIKPLAAQTNAVFEIFDDAYSYAPAGVGDSVCAVYYNTGADCPIKPSSQFKLVLELTTAVSNFPSVPYDPFIFRTNQTLNTATGTYVQGVAKGTEVHLPGQSPSNRADKTLFGTKDDRSTLGSSATYRTAANLPWALNIPNEWTYPAEFVDVVRTFPSMVTWAGSAGSKNTDWYVAPSNRTLTFKNGR